ncbi:cytochrome P450 [Streptomyces sp. NPDC049910]|uniref:cytochrome P450 n=1 Tax=Streptomyces sp. NPDC049910 TaxID=3155278 RepID=UPI00343D582C
MTSDSIPVPETGRRCPEPLYGPEFAADPAAAYRRMRRTGPTAPVELSPGVRATLVTGYDAALHVLRSSETFSKDSRRWQDMADGTVPADCPVAPMMAYRPNALLTDGPEHRRLREAITDSLGGVEPHALRGYVEQSADALIDRFAAAGEADLLAGYAQPLPLLVLNQMFGCPPEYGERLVEGMAGIFELVDAEKANELLTRTVGALIALKREKPGRDVTSRLIAHPARLTDEELVHTLVLLIGAGTEPEQNLIANSLRLLLSDDRFAGSLSGGSLPVEDALDEVLWTDPPMANYAVHFPVHDVLYEGTLLREGHPLVISFAAANTDPALAAEQHPGNRAHLAWSAGPHSCPAQGAARLIAAVAVEKLLDRLPDMELAVPVQDLEWRPGPFHRALAALPVSFQPAVVTRAAAAGRGAADRRPAGDEASAAADRRDQAPPGGRRSAPAAAAPVSGWARLLAWWRGE